MKKIQMVVVRGKYGEIVRDTFDAAQSVAYTTLAPAKRMGDPAKGEINTSSYYDLLVYVEGEEVHRCEAVFYRGCNALAMPSKFCSEVFGKEKK